MSKLTKVTPKGSGGRWGAILRENAGINQRVRAEAGKGGENHTNAVKLRQAGGGHGQCRINHTAATPSQAATRPVTRSTVGDRLII